ncbi:MAG: agmatinase [Gammaproteobacteria bacterium]|nr:agmatinase [Gammaproteobacteria bacterium]
MSFENPANSHSIFANIFSYMGTALTRNPDEADVFVIGLPYDLGTSGRSGTRSGPAGIRNASANLRWEEKRWPWDFNVFDRLRVADYGDLEFPTGNHEALFEAVDSHYGNLLAAGKTVLSFGGDHFITLPLLRAHHRQFGKLAMIHFDAHTDTYREDESNYSHGSMFYHAPREGLIDADKSIQIGIRTEYTESRHDFEVISAAAANDLSAEVIVERIRQRVGDSPCYLTFDIDCLDPAYAPGTGTPVAGGLTSDRALKIIRGLQGLNLIGMDLVEVAPSYDHAEITSLAGATLGLEMLYVLGANRK